MSRPSTPISSDLSRRAIQSLAERLSAALNLSASNIREVVGRLGGSIRVVDLWAEDEEKPEALYVKPDGSFEIVVPEHTTVERDNFTIAHELGHYVLHYHLRRNKIDQDQPFRATRYGRGRIEWEANWFAAAFLMPKVPFERAFKEYNGDLRKVARQFRVSNTAASVRAKALGLTNGDRI